MSLRDTARGDLAVARAQSAPRGKRLYESHYLTAVAPDGGRAAWIRYTADKPRGEPARSRLWCTLFDRAEAAPLARRTAGAGEIVDASTVMWAQIGGSTIGPGVAEGELEELEWQLRWQGGTPALGYLPRSWLYDRSWPRSNGAALVPDATFGGWVKTVDGRIDIDGWRGIVGHNWGSDHADRWIWVHVTGLGERDEEGWLDMVLARTRVGPLITPWLPAGAIQLEGRRWPIGLGGSMGGLSVEIGGDRLEIGLPRLSGGGLRLAASMPATDTANWDYSTPGGGVRGVRNCSRASGLIELADGPAIEIEGRLIVEIGE